MEASRAALVGTLALLGLLVISMGWGRAMTGGRRGDGHFGEKISLHLAVFAIVKAELGLLVEELSDLRVTISLHDDEPVRLTALAD